MRLVTRNRFLGRRRLVDVSRTVDPDVGSDVAGRGCADVFIGPANVYVRANAEGASRLVNARHEGVATRVLRIAINSHKIVSLFAVHESASLQPIRYNEHRCNDATMHQLSDRFDLCSDRR